jgi:hypothetical protein
MLSNTLYISVMDMGWGPFDVGLVPQSLDNDVACSNTLVTLDFSRFKNNGDTVVGVSVVMA